MILSEDFCTASQTARWIARSATGFDIASNVTREVNTEIKVGIVCVRRSPCGILREGDNWVSMKQQAQCDQEEQDSKFSDS